MLPLLSTNWAGVWLFFSAPSTDVLSFTAVAAIAVLTVLAIGAVRRAAALGGMTYRPATLVVIASAEPDAVPRHCDPDAAGRARPRAPTADPAA